MERMKKLQCAEARQIDLVDYLASLGHQPKKTRNNDYWYLSPLREEKTPSFKVNRRFNVWYDHGTGKGGDLIDFGTLYFNCSTSDLLNKLSQQPPILAFSFHPPSTSSNPHTMPASFAGEKKDTTEGKIAIVASRPLQEKSLLDYLQKRNIPLDIAQRNCKEVDFLLYGKTHTAIGFQNNAGGYELRSQNFKGSSAPKAITFIDNGQKQVSVFEGIFSYLSFQAMSPRQGHQEENYLILNSLSFFEKSRPTMEKHSHINLFLDRDTAGINATRQALQWDNDRYIDRSQFYHNCKDLNDLLIQSKIPKKSKRIGLRL